MQAFPSHDPLTRLSWYMPGQKLLEQLLSVKDEALSRLKKPHFCMCFSHMKFLVRVGCDALGIHLLHGLPGTTPNCSGHFRQQQYMWWGSLVVLILGWRGAGLVIAGAVTYCTSLYPCKEAACPSGMRAQEQQRLISLQLVGADALGLLSELPPQPLWPTVSTINHYYCYDQCLASNR